MRETAEEDEGRAFAMTQAKHVVLRGRVAQEPAQGAETDVSKEVVGVQQSLSQSGIGIALQQQVKHHRFGISRKKTSGEWNHSLHTIGTPRSHCGHNARGRIVISVAVLQMELRADTKPHVWVQRRGRRGRLLDTLEGLVEKNASIHQEEEVSKTCSLGGLKWVLT